MTGRVFLDSNVVLYSLDLSTAKGRKAEDLLNRRPMVSVQVVNETVYVCIRKLRMEAGRARAIGNALLIHCEVKALDVADVQLAFELSARHRLSHWDALIAASAVRHGCETLYSEDMHSGLQLSADCRIVNPFADA